MAKYEASLGIEDLGSRPWLLWSTTIVFYALALLCAFVLGIYDVGSADKLLGMEWNSGLSLLIVLAGYTASQFKSIKADELGAIDFFGKPMCLVRPGPVFVPPLCSFNKEVARSQQNELPAEPEKIWRGKDDQAATVPAEEAARGFRPPNRVVFGNYNKDESDKLKIPTDDPLDRRMTQEVAFTVTLAMDDYIRFITTVGSYKEALQRINDLSLVVCQELFGGLTPAVANCQLNKFSGKIREALVISTESWGLKLVQFNIKQIVLAHKLNESVQGIAVAGAEAVAVGKRAEGEKKKRTLEGEGSAAAEKAILTARGEGIRDGAKAAGVEADTFLGSNTAVDIAKGANDTIILGGGGFAELAGVGKAIFSKKDRASDSPDKKEGEK